MIEEIGDAAELALDGAQFCHRRKRRRHAGRDSTPDGLTQVGFWGLDLLVVYMLKVSGHPGGEPSCQSFELLKRKGGRVD